MSLQTLFFHVLFGAYLFTRSQAANLTLSQPILSFDQTSNNGFGSAAGIYHNTIVLGAYGWSSNTGTAHVYKFNGSEWLYFQNLTASDGTTSSYFGDASASISANTIAVGAYPKNSVYIFKLNGGSYQQTQKITGTGNFGRSMAFSPSGDLLVVGADSARKVTIFKYNGSAWYEFQVLTTQHNANTFGTFVAVSKNLIVVGARYATNQGVGNAGGTYVFRLNGTQYVEEQSLLITETPQSNDDFGIAIAINANEDTIVVGASNDQFQGTKWKGSAYIFRYNGANWNQFQKLLPSDVPSSPNTFAYCLGMIQSDETIVIGAPSNPGGVYIFEKNASGMWNETRKLNVHARWMDVYGGRVVFGRDNSPGYVLAKPTPPPTFAPSSMPSQAPTNFPGKYILQKVFTGTGTGTTGWGNAGAAFPNLIVSSATTGTQGGDARVLLRKNGEWIKGESLRPFDGTSGNFFGWSYSMDADQTTGDIAIGAYGATAVYVFNRQGPVHKIVSPVANNRFGNSVSISGNTLAVGANQESSNTGAVYVYVKNASAWSLQEKITAFDQATGDSFGMDIVLEGNFLAVGAPHNDGGCVYIYGRLGATWNTAHKLLPSDSGNHAFGHSISKSKDYMFIGAVWRTGGGGLYVFKKSVFTWTQTQILFKSGSNHFGYTSAVNGNGNILAVGAPNVGHVVVYHLNGTVWQEKQVLNPMISSSLFGNSVAISCDTLYVGAPGSTVNKVFLYSNGVCAC